MWYLLLFLYLFFEAQSGRQFFLPFFVRRDSPRRARAFFGAETAPWPVPFSISSSVLCSTKRGDVDGGPGLG